MLLGATLYPRPFQIAAIEFAIEQRRLTPGHVQTIFGSRHANDSGQTK